MAETKTKTLNMVFLDTEGAKVQMNISNVNPALTEAEVKTLMDTIIAKNVFARKNGEAFPDALGSAGIAKKYNG